MMQRGYTAARRPAYTTGMRFSMVGGIKFMGDAADINESLEQALSK